MCTRGFDKDIKTNEKYYYFKYERFAIIWKEHRVSKSLYEGKSFHFLMRKQKFKFTFFCIIGNLISIMNC